MTVETPTRHSPLADRAAELDRLPAGIRVTEVPFLTQLTLRVDPGGRAAAAVARVLGTTLPTTPCTYLSAGEVDVLWLGPDEWLVVAPPGVRERLHGSLRAAIGSVTDVSAQRTSLSLSGPLTREVLARGCAIDLHPRVSPAGTCVQTLLAQVTVVLLVRDSGGPEVRLLVRSSFASYVASWLIDACTEYR